MIYDGEIFKNRVFDEKKLKSYGFKKNKGSYLYKTTLSDGEFNFIIEISAKNTVNTEVIEAASNEPYDAVYIKDAQGKFIGKIKNEFEQILTDIAEKCFNYSVFKNEYVNQIIDYVKARYGTSPEYLWEKFPDYAVFRDSTSSRWYGIILTVEKKNSGIDKDGIIEIIDLKASPDKVTALVDGVKYFPAYHMNKKHWYTVVLDGSVDIRDIYSLIDESYNSIK